jgi:hypothetical protein
MAPKKKAKQREQTREQLISKLGDADLFLILGQFTLAPEGSTIELEPEAGSSTHFFTRNQIAEILYQRGRAVSGYTPAEDPLSDWQACPSCPRP